MATEQYFQQATTQDVFNKEDAASLAKWRSVSEEINESENNAADGFNCNICLDTVNDPVVTLCGHLYCWPCIYKWIHYQSASAEYPEKQQPQCPVCKTEVSQKTLVPLYGRGQTTKPSDGKVPDVGMFIPRRPASPRCGVDNTTTTSPRPALQLHHRGYLQPPQPYPGVYAATPMSSFGGLTMSNSLSPTTQMFGEMVYARIFGNSETLYTYPNSYNLAGISTARARRQAMQTDRSLGRLSFFFLCCLILCLLLF